MKIKSASALRKEIAKSYGALSPSIDLNFIGSFDGDLSTGKKGFFNVFHGIKPDIPNYLRGILKIAEDGQAVYEFIQNAVDCDSRNFWLYITEDYFLAINNGIPFTERDIASILNIGQSDKGKANEDGNCDNIGRFGIGFKLVHRLVGENDGIDELCNVNDGELRGPIMLSWAHPNQLKEILESDSNPISVDRSDENYYKAPWLFKILLTNFPAQPNEGVKDINFQKFVPFPSAELQQMRTHLNEVIGSSFDPIKYSKGSIFYIKLGKGKYSKLSEEMASLENGVNYSLNFFKRLQEITINDHVITKRKINWLYYEIPIDSEKFNVINPEYKLCPIKVWFGYSSTTKEILDIKKQPNFYKYFPLGDEVNQLGFVINCDAFDIESNRRKLHKSNINENLLKTVGTLLNTEFETLKLNNPQEFDKIFLSVMFSDSKIDESNLWKSKVLINELKTYFDSNVPSDSGYFSKGDCIIKGFKANIPLENVGLSNKHWFKWNSMFDPEVLQRAIEELGLKKWYLRNLINEITSETLENYLKSISDTQYILFFNEILSEELTAKLKKDLETKKWIKLSDGKFASLTDFVEDTAWFETKISSEESNVFLKFGQPSCHFMLTKYAGKLLEINDGISVTWDSILELLENNNIVISRLSKKECQTLISFTDRMGIKVTQLPPFFYSRTGILSKLECLISPQVLNVPSWLYAYVISEPEFFALQKGSLKYLINEDKIFEDLLCKEGIFERIVQIFPAEQISKFYENLSHFHNFVPEGAEINYDNIPCVYTSKKRFSTATNLFFPAVIKKEKPSKIADYLAFINKYTKLETPYIASIKFIKKLDLSTNDTYTLSENLLTESQYSENEIITLLDFLVLNKEEDFFEKFTINSDNNHYTVNDSLGVRNYFSADKLLRKYIQDVGAELELISSKLYNPDLKAIGLLENENLLAYLIENGFANTSFVKFVYKYKTNTELCKLYLNSLKEIKISSKTDYSNKSDEFRIFELITHLEDADLITFRSEIYIDEESLNTKALSNDIWFKIEDKPKKISIQLSEILKEYKGKTYSKDTFKNKFRLHHNEEHLKKINKIFDSRNLTIDEIKNKLLGLGSINFNAKQLIFWHFYLLEKSDYTLPEEFSSFLGLNEIDNPKYESEVKEYLSHCMLEKINEPFKFFTFPDYFFPKYKIWNDEYAIGVEKVHGWLREWVEEEDEKLTFLKNIGMNDSDSPIVKFRKAIKEFNKDEMDTHRSSVPRFHLSYTLNWIHECKIQVSKESIKPIYDKLQRDNAMVNRLLIPTVVKKVIKLIKWEEGQVFHLKQEGWGNYGSAIESAVKKEGQYIIDDTLNDVYQAQLGVVSYTLASELDMVKINSNSILLDANYYKSWSGIDKITIKVFSSDSLPYVSKYRDLIQFPEEEAFTVKKINNYYLVANSSQNRIPECIIENYQDSHLEGLKTHKERYIRENESDDITKLALSKGLEGDQRIATNNEAKKVAIEWLEANDYECSDVVTDFDRLCNIIKDGNRIEAIVNSISGGVVYIRPMNWLKLMEDNTFLLLVNKIEVTKLDSISDIIERYPKTLLRVDNSADVEKHLAAIAEETSGTATTQFVFFDEEAKFREVLTTMQKLADNQNKELNIEIPVNHDFLNE